MLECIHISFNQRNIELLNIQPYVSFKCVLLLLLLLICCRSNKCESKTINTHTIRSHRTELKIGCDLSMKKNQISNYQNNAKIVWQKIIHSWNSHFFFSRNSTKKNSKNFFFQDFYFFLHLWWKFDELRWNCMKFRFFRLFPRPKTP